MDDAKMAVTQIMPPDFTLYPDEIFKNNLVWVGGGMSVGTRGVYRQFAEEYTGATDAFLDQGLSNTDQQVLYAMFTHPHGLQHRVSTQLQMYTWSLSCVWDCWFYLALRNISHHVDVISSDSSQSDDDMSDYVSGQSDDDMSDYVSGQSDDDMKSQDQTLSELLAPFMGQIRSEVNNLYVRADTNNNGHFDLDDLRSVFEEYDINKNHEVTRDEFVQHFAGNSSTLRIVALGLFLDMDSDKNGMLEQNDATTYFNKIDTDGRRVRLLDYGAVGLWDCGAVGLWDCGAVGLWDCGTVVLWDCGAVGLWAVGLWGCGVGLWCCGLWGYGTVGLWDCGAVGLWGCGAVGADAKHDTSACCGRCCCYFPLLKHKLRLLLLLLPADDGEVNREEFVSFFTQVSKPQVTDLYLMNAIVLTVDIHALDDRCDRTCGRTRVTHWHVQ
ncbi:hypothetical protein C0Q70_18368 [Pomacea canaliculata]|uniref:EF-hand domain-containing protein n=1 Tax=Pomacea canaliculata TaxID=400727 RepID=A0A2T7NN23_POMCA|nr:hypothetical protein C0Q70_18368 [Pomacea canaliculata]